MIKFVTKWYIDGDNSATLSVNPDNVCTFRSKTIERNDSIVAEITIYTVDGHKTTIYQTVNSHDEAISKISEFLRIMGVN